MRAYLTEANEDLLYQIEVVQELLGSARVAGELTPYVAQVSQMCAELRRQALRKLIRACPRTTSVCSTLCSGQPGIRQLRHPLAQHLEHSGTSPRGWHPARVPQPAADQLDGSG